MISEASRKILEELNFSKKTQAERQVPKETDMRKPEVKQSTSKQTEVFICELCSHKLASEVCLDLHYETCRRRKGKVLTICISL